MLSVAILQSQTKPQKDSLFPLTDEMIVSSPECVFVIVRIGMDVMGDKLL